MKLCTETITVFNKKVDASNGWNVYVPTVIRGASWFCEIASVVDSSGLHAANHYIIRIPESADFSGKKYVDPIAYRDASMVAGIFTLANGDVVVKAEVDDDSMTLKQLHEQYPDCCTVLGVTDNRRAPNAPHWKVVGS